jgi:hypothetical protein
MLILQPTSKGKLVSTRKLSDKRHRIHLYPVEDAVRSDLYGASWTFGCATCRDAENCCEPYLRFLTDLTIRSMFQVIHEGVYYPTLPVLLPLNRYKTLWAPLTFNKSMYGTSRPLEVNITTTGDFPKSMQEVGFFYGNETLQAVIYQTTSHLTAMELIDDSKEGGFGCRNPDMMINLSTGYHHMSHNLFCLHYGKCNLCLTEDVTYQRIIGRDFW